MKKTVIQILLILGTAGTLRAAGFEGEVDYKISETGGKEHQIHYAIKDRRVRMNMDMEGGKGGKSTVILDRGNRVMWILTPEKKMAIKRAMPDVKAVAEKRKSDKKGSVIKTGRKQVVAGHPCEVFTFTDEAAEGEVCNATDMGALPVTEGENRPMSVWEKEAIEKGYFPLKMISKNLHSGKTTLMEATRIESKSLNQADFEVPSDYKIVEGFGGMMGAGKSPAAGAPNTRDMMKKMMNASPEDRAKMAEEMRKAYGAGK